MKQENINEFKEIIRKSFIINKYLEDYLKDDIMQIMEDYELNPDYNENEMPTIIGYTINKPDNIVVSISFFDEASENGIGLETRDININDFLNWLKDN